MAPLSLDDPGVRERLDREGMLAHLQAIPEQCDLGWRRGIEAAIPVHREAHGMVTDEEVGVGQGK